MDMPMDNSNPDEFNDMADDNMENDMNMEDNDDMQMPEENPYDSNFDAGVEADEDEDPKKYIEQLSGKLSQSLNSYQESLPKPDADTAKYAAGMVVKAAIKNLSQDDIKDILDKLKDGDSDDLEDSDSENDDTFDDDFEPNEQNDNNDQDMMDDEMNNDVKESKKYNLDEIFQELTDSEPNIKEKPIMDISFRKKPFTSPNF